MNRQKIVALAGGVGGAKLVDGLAQVLSPEDLTVIVNTADDFSYMKLNISPDLDTVCYTLAGVANPETGWGKINETWNVYEKLKQMGMPIWFQLGDSDLATHLTRTVRFAQGWSLSKITNDFCKRWGIDVQVLPMSDDEVHTKLLTNEGEMEFQEYFVNRKYEPVVQSIRFVGAENSKPAPGVIEAINEADVVVICPSNPWLSIDPILAIPAIRTAISSHFIVAVSPIIGAQTIKGPAAKLFSEFGIPPSVLAIAEHYGNILKALFIDWVDKDYEKDIHALGIRTKITDILMRDRSDRGRLAREVLNYINGWEKIY